MQTTSSPAFNSYSVIKTEEFQVEQNDDSDDSDSTEIIKMLRDEFDDFEDTIHDVVRRETETQNISNTQVINITLTNNTSDSSTDDCITDNQFPKIGSENYFPTWLFNNMVPKEVNLLPADITGQKLYTVTGTNNDNWKEKV